MNYPLSMVITLVLYTFTNPFAQAQLLGGAVPALCNCSAGTYCAVVLGCAPCEAGTSSEAGSTSCTQCPAVGQLRRNTASLTKACPVGRYWGCVDVSNHLTSCGGCPGSEEGVDCTVFDAMASAKCVKGKCQYECPRGHTYGVEGCRRLRGRRI